MPRKTRQNHPSSYSRKYRALPESNGPAHCSRHRTTRNHHDSAEHAESNLSRAVRPSSPRQTVDAVAGVRTVVVGAASDLIQETAPLTPAEALYCMILQPPS